VLGLVLYIGANLKASRSRNKERVTKLSYFDQQFNRLSMRIFVLMIATSLAMETLHGFERLFYVQLFRYILLFSNSIPISLRVNVEIARIVQSLQISRDRLIAGCTVRNSNIIQELGKIEILLTDKTGTLTKNQMAFRSVIISEVDYTQDSIERLLHFDFSLESSENSSRSKRGLDSREDEIAMIR